MTQRHTNHRQLPSICLNRPHPSHQSVTIGRETVSTTALGSGPTGLPCVRPVQLITIHPRNSGRCASPAVLVFGPNTVAEHVSPGAARSTSVACASRTIVIGGAGIAAAARQGLSALQALPFERTHLPQKDRDLSGICGTHNDEDYHASDQDPAFTSTVHRRAVLTEPFNDIGSLNMTQRTSAGRSRQRSGACADSTRNDGSDRIAGGKPFGRGDLRSYALEVFGRQRPALYNRKELSPRLRSSQYIGRSRVVNRYPAISLVNVNPSRRRCYQSGMKELRLHYRCGTIPIRVGQQRKSG